MLLLLLYYKVRDGISYAFPNFHDAMIIFMLHHMSVVVSQITVKSIVCSAARTTKTSTHCITYPLWGESKDDQMPFTKGSISMSWHHNGIQNCLHIYHGSVSTLTHRQNCHNFADSIFKCSLFYKKLSISFQISLKFVSNGSINNNPTLVQIMAWRRTGDKPSSEPMVA